MATKGTFPTTTSNTLLYSLLSSEAANNTTRAWPKPFSLRTIWDASSMAIKVGSSLETILILGSNLLLLLLIITSPPLRRQLRYQLILSLTVANLTVGVFSSPFTVDLLVRQEWVHGCAFSMVRSLLMSFVQNFVSMWGMVLLLLHYVARLRSYEPPAWFLVRLPPRLVRALPALLVASPWIFTLVLQMPLFFLGLHHSTWGKRRCPLILKYWVSIFLTVDCYILPSILLIVLVVVIIFRCKDGVSGHGHHGTDLGTSLVTSPKADVEGCRVHVLGAVLTVLLMGPDHIFNGFMLHKSSSQEITIITIVLCMLLSELLPFVLALLWLLMMPDLRRFLLALTVRCRSSPASPTTRGDSSIGPMSFRSLRDEQ